MTLSRSLARFADLGPVVLPSYQALRDLPLGIGAPDLAIVLENSDGSGIGATCWVYHTTGGPYVDNGETVLVMAGGDGFSAWIRVALMTNDAAQSADMSDFGAAFVQLSDAASARTSLGLGNAAVQSVSYLTNRANHTGTQIVPTGTVLSFEDGGFIRSNAGRLEYQDNTTSNEWVPFTFTGIEQ